MKENIYIIIISIFLSNCICHTDLNTKKEVLLKIIEPSGLTLSYNKKIYGP